MEAHLSPWFSFLFAPAFCSKYEIVFRLKTLRGSFYDSLMFLTFLKVTANFKNCVFIIFLTAQNYSSFGKINANLHYIKMLYNAHAMSINIFLFFFSSFIM